MVEDSGALYQVLSRGDPEKVVIARRLQVETVATVGWIAERLHRSRRNDLMAQS